jgi:hypothetical protein
VYTRQPFDVPAAQPCIGDPVTQRVAEVAVVAYEVVLHLLLRMFTHTDETDEQLATLANGAIRTMAGVLRPLATALTTLPAGPEYPGRTAGFAFEMYYVMGNLVPWREPAWALLHERASILVERCADLSQADGAPAAVREAGKRTASIAATLAAHVPAGLLPAGVSRSGT